jgi:LysR family transcriptional regulator, carnitine catabolism transcriptional activator
VERRQLEYFVAVADHLSFTGAAHVLHVAQPSLSQAIKALERELGVELFHRLGHRIQLTSAGQALLAPARQALRDFAAAAAAVVNVADLASGRLEIAAIPAVASDPLAMLVARFREQFPAIEIRIAHPGLGDGLDFVREGDTELALTMTEDTRDLAVMRFPPDEVHVALPPSSKWPQGSALPAAELERMDLIAITANKALVIGLLSQIGVTPRFPVETAHRESVLPLVLGGVGAALVPAGTAQTARELGAVVCRIDPPVTRKVVLVHRKGRLTPAGAAFVEVAAHVAAERSTAVRPSAA